MSPPVWGSCLRKYLAIIQFVSLPFSQNQFRCILDTTVMNILLVEDEHKIASAIKQGFRQESYATEICYDGESGLAAALGGEYDIIILDRMLPGLDGVAICEQIRAKGIHTPILMLTAKGQIRDRVTGLNAGADDYLTKPFAFAELLARVRALLRRPGETISNVLQVGDITLDTLTFEVKRGDTPVKLSQTEYALLEYLMRNPGRIVSKDAIINHVWDFDADILPNTVEAYIGYLRNKIDVAGQDSYIQTVRGTGYVMRT